MHRRSILATMHDLCDRFATELNAPNMTIPSPKRIAVTGAAGQICYSLLFRVAHAEVYGPDQPVILQLLDLPQVLPNVRGVS